MKNYLNKSNAEALRLARIEEAKKIEAMAGDLTSYTGEEVYAEYNGQLVPVRSMARPYAPQRGLDSLQGEVKTFTFRIANTDGAAKTFFLTGGLLPERTGIVKQGAFASVVGGDSDKLTGTGDPTSIEEFKEFIKRNPLVVGFVRLESNVDGQMSYSIQQFRGNPFLGPENVVGNIQPSNYKGAGDFQSRIVEIPGAKLTFDDQTATRMTVAPNSVLSITIGVTQIYNAAAIANSK
jgi:hypothetical protein